MDTFSVAFFGHRDFNEHLRCSEKIEEIIRDLMLKNTYVEFLVGRNGEFDIFAASSVVSVKKKYDVNNSALVLVLPYLTAECKNNEEYFEKYYDEIEICPKSSIAHYKSAIQIRNREMVDRADLVICFIDHKNGGAYKTVQYAQKINKKIINLAV